MPQQLITKTYIENFGFMKDSKLLKDAPFCGMSLKSAGSMRFRWNEKNSCRDNFLQEIAGCELSVVPVELIHSKIVYDVENSEDTKFLKGDGIITTNKKLMPVVTVADCVPIYIYDYNKKIFGIVHSGWKGTGIVKEAIETCVKKYHSRIEDFSVTIGPHIHDCCYIVNEERAEYFRQNFSVDSAIPLEENGTCYAGGRGLVIEWDNGKSSLFRLSLLKANLAILDKLGVPAGNINIVNECTCCNEEFGSNRRETAEASKALGRKLSPEEAALKFTVQAAFIHW